MYATSPPCTPLRSRQSSSVRLPRTRGRLVLSLAKSQSPSLRQGLIIDGDPDDRHDRHCQLFSRAQALK